MMDEAVFTKFRAVDLHLGHALGGRELRLLEGPRGPRPLGRPGRDGGLPLALPLQDERPPRRGYPRPRPRDPRLRGLRRPAIPRLLEASQGHALVLFTSYEAMKSAFEAAKPRMAELGITMLRQGENERSKLLDAFKADLTRSSSPPTHFGREWTPPARPCSS